jgi:hypothetical protein
MFHWATPPDFLTDLVIKAKKIGIPATKMKTLNIAYREKV